MKLVQIESPFAASHFLDRQFNMAYLAAALRSSLCSGEAPFASHGLYTLPGVLDDSIPSERDLGMAAGWAILERADCVAFYIDRGWTRGMFGGLERARNYQKPIEQRRVVGWSNRTGSVVDFCLPHVKIVDAEIPTEPCPVSSAALRGWL